MPSRTYRIEPVTGYAPTIGRLVGILSYARQTTLAAVDGLTTAQLDHLHDSSSNSIGALLAHMAVAERGNQVLTFEERRPTASEQSGWEPALTLGAEARRLLRNKPLDHYLHEPGDVRRLTLEGLAARDDAWLERTLSAAPAMNAHWAWFHVAEDEINHRGQIDPLAARPPRPGRGNKADGLAGSIGGDGAFPRAGRMQARADPRGRAATSREPASPASSHCATRIDDVTVAGAGHGIRSRQTKSIVMPDPPVTERLEILEKTVAALETLPERVGAVELQIVQLRDEIRTEFSAIRQKFSAECSAIRQEFSAECSAIRQETVGMGASLREELQAEIRAGDEETRRYMRVLHEDVIARIATLGEGRRPRKK